MTQSAGLGRVVLVDMVINLDTLCGKSKTHNETITLRRHRSKEFIWYLDLYQPRITGEQLCTRHQSRKQVIRGNERVRGEMRLIGAHQLQSWSPLLVRDGIPGALSPSLGHPKVIREDRRQRLRAVVTKKFPRVTHSPRLRFQESDVAPWETEDNIYTEHSSVQVDRMLPQTS
ncbi:hypothetical protein CSIM01_06844 [Colletotrichum simmondsii]|uniref:Uncharacterized protein n=1 Tax=Colletotrichum simmondsii TaxID=703756 RepID=A0A135TF89_9PEZI|nr:hypothetical protein CSIM01_06844 [Colletotrichum simmondsii]